MAAMSRLVLAMFSTVTAQQELKLEMGGYMPDATSYCYRKLVADPLCCKDSRIPMSVRHVELEREGAEWTCDGGIECKDDAKGSRGKDMLWWPKGADCKTPRVLFVHGGGWQHHGPKEASYDVFAAKLSQVSGAIIMVPDYLLVPLGNFLSITDYLLKAWDFLTTHGPAGDECSGTPPLFVAGDSSGAASALSMLLRLRKQGFPEASGFFAFSPWMNLACDSPTYYSNAFTLVDDTSGKVMDGDILFRGPPQNVSKSLQQLALKYFQGDATRLKDPLYSPFHATEEQLDELPPVYLAVSGSEVMTGDSMIFAQRAAVRGVRVYVSMFPGMWHGFPQYIEGCGSGTELWQGTTALSHAGDFVSQISAYLRSRPDLQRLPQSGEKTPRTNVYYPNPEGAKPWSFVGELSLGLPKVPLPPAPSPSQPSSMQPGFQPEQLKRWKAPSATAYDDGHSELSMVPPRALPRDVVIDCPQETVTGAVMSGMLLGCLSMTGCLIGAAWYLSRRAHGDLPSFCPDFLQHPYENYRAEAKRSSS